MTTAQTAGTLAKLLQDNFGLAPRHTSAIVPGILGEFAVIRLSDLPEVRAAEPGYLGIGKKRFNASSAEMQRIIALDHLALSLYLEAQKTDAAAADVRRDYRRDELAGRFMGNKHYSYEETPESTQAAIDQIIELEAQA